MAVQYSDHHLVNKPVFRPIFEYLSGIERYSDARYHGTDFDFDFDMIPISG